MKKSFLANLLFLIILNLIIKPFWFLGIEVAVQNKVGNAEYGLYFSLLGFSLMLNILLDVGITNFNNREVARHPQLANKYFNNIILVKLYLGIVYALAMVIAGFFMGYSGQHYKILMILVVNQFLASLLLYLRSNINGLHLFVIDSILSVTDKLLMIVLCGSILWFRPDLGFKIEWFVYAQTLSYLLPIAIAFLVIKNRFVNIKPKNDFRYFIHIARESKLFAILVTLMFLYSRIDAVLLERLLPNGQFEAGIYAQSYRLVDLASNYAFLFSTLLLPIFARMLKEKKDVSGIVLLSANMLVIPAIMLAIAGWFFKAEIIRLLYHTAPGTGIELGFLFIGFIGIAMNYIFGTLLTANGNLKELIAISIFIVVLNLTLNFSLIPVYKTLGAAIAFMATQLSSSILQFYIAHKRVAFKIGNGFYFKAAIIAIILVLVAHFCANGSFNLISKLGIFVTAALVMVFATGVLKIKELLILVKEKE